METNIFIAGGPTMWLLLIFSLTIVALTVKKSIDLYGVSTKQSTKLETGLNAIIYFGGLSLVFGILGQISGIHSALVAISKASDISPQIIFMGFSQSFISTLFGFWILIFSSIFWFVLRARYKKINDNHVPA